MVVAVEGVGGEVEWEGGAGGFTSSQQASLLPPSDCLASPPQTLLSLHKLFTSGYTKGNSAALIVAEGKFIKKHLRPGLRTPLGHSCKNYAKPHLQRPVTSVWIQFRSTMPVILFISWHRSADVLIANLDIFIGVKGLYLLSHLYFLLYRTPASRLILQENPLYTSRKQHI